MKYHKLNNFIILLSVIFFLLTACKSHREVSTESTKDKPAYSYYIKSSQYVESQDYQHALAALDTAISLKPEVSNFYYAKGQIYEIMGENVAAIAEYENSLIYKSHFPDCWLKLAVLYMDQNEPEKASQLLNDLTDFRPDSLRYELLLADAYVADNKSMLALDRIKYYENQGARSPETDRIKGMAYFLQNDYKNTITYLEQYVKSNAQHYRAQKILGMAFLKSGSWEKGISHLNKALTIQSDDPEIYLYRAQYFSQMQKLDAASEQYKLAIKLDSTNSKTLLESAKFMLSINDTTYALELLIQGIYYNESCWECYKYLGIIMAHKGERQKAIMLLKKYISNIYFKDDYVEKLLYNLNEMDKTSSDYYPQ
jgi:tetratricopeptide (TPR) repeat protein